MKKRFEVNGDKITSFLGNSLNPIKSNTKNCIAFYITPWLYTDVPWFSMVLATLVQKRGFEIVFILDDLGFEENDNNQIEIIRKRLNTLINPEGIINLSLLGKSVEIDAELKSNIVDDSVKSNMMCNFKIEYIKNVTEKYYNNLSDNYDYFLSLLSEYKFKKIVIPGGIYGNSGLLLALANKFDIPTITYDSGEKEVLTGNNSVAAHRMDTIECVKYVKEVLEEKQKEYLVNNGYISLENRRKGNDFYKYQKVDYDYSFKKLIKKEDPIIFFPLNLFSDAAAIGMNHLFNSINEWLVDTIDFSLKETNSTILIRDHPATFGNYNNSSLMASLGSRYLGNSRVHFFSANDDINTYNLLELADVVLPFTSTVGIEAGMINKKVVLCTDTYYSEGTFVTKANTIEEYFGFIKQYCMENESSMNSIVSEDGALFYNISQEFGNLRTFFTPQPQDFDLWINSTIDVLLQDEDIKLLIMSIVSNYSLMALNLNRSLQG